LDRPFSWANSSKSPVGRESGGLSGDGAILKDCAGRGYP
jgi:hypothetical protein